MKQLILHGAIILLLGLICGAPLGSSVVRRKSEETIRAWRVAHSSLVMGGILLLALAGVVSHLQLATWALHVFVWSSIGASYAFAIVLPAGATVGHRGLSLTGPSLNRLLYLGNMLGVMGLLVGGVFLVWGAYAAL
jgi:hypothetical protein